MLSTRCLCAEKRIKLSADSRANFSPASNSRCIKRFEILRLIRWNLFVRVCLSRLRLRFTRESCVFSIRSPRRSVFFFLHRHRSIDVGRLCHVISRPGEFSRKIPKARKRRFRMTTHRGRILFDMRANQMKVELSTKYSFAHCAADELKIIKITCDQENNCGGAEGGKKTSPSRW